MSTRCTCARPIELLMLPEFLIVEHQIQLFHMEETQGWAHKAIRRLNIPVVVQLAGPWFINGELSPIEKKRAENRNEITREGRANRGAAGIRSPSKNVLDRTERFYGPLKEETRVIADPISSVDPSRRWDVGKCDRNALLFVGRFDQIKGGDVALRAFAKVAPAFPKLRLLFVGPDVGLELDHGQIFKFDEFVRKFIPDELRNRITSVGTQASAAIEALRRSSYATIIPSRYETFGNVVIEAMAIGAPIVATDTGGFPR